MKYQVVLGSVPVVDSQQSDMSLACPSFPVVYIWLQASSIGCLLPLKGLSLLEEDRYKMAFIILVVSLVRTHCNLVDILMDFVTFTHNAMQRDVTEGFVNKLLFVRLHEERWFSLHQIILCLIYLFIFSVSNFQFPAQKRLMVIPNSKPAFVAFLILYIFHIDQKIRYLQVESKALKTVWYSQ